MKKTVLVLFLSAIALFETPANATESTKAPKQNLQATRNYYTQLVSGAQPRLAELTMLMSMLPKGGDIHHHYSGAIYAEDYLDWVAQQGFCIYRESDVLNKQEKFRIETRLQFVNDANKSCIKVDAVRKDSEFYRALIATWSVLDYAHQVHPQAAPDQHFFNTFAYFSGMSKYSTKLGLKLLKQQAKAENVQYLETLLRSAPITDHPEFSAKLDALAMGVDGETAQAAFSQFADFLAQDAGAQKRIADYVKEIASDAADIDDAEFSLRIQSYVSRNSAPSKVFSGLFSAFSASQDNPLIVGVNILGSENAPVALRDYALHMQMLAYLKQRFPRVRLSLHAGELVLGLVPPEHLQHHIRSALDIAGAERIGHGVDIAHEAKPDQLLADLKRRDVAVEINLSSNAFILGLQAQAHPITLYLQHGVPFVISSDDAGVFRSNLSHEYLLFASRYRPSYETLKQTVYNSIRYSFLSPEHKKSQLQQLDQRFIKFESVAARLARSEKKH